MTYPILPAGTVVKPTISIGRFRVDGRSSRIPGPAHDRTRQLPISVVRDIDAEPPQD